MVVLYSLYVLHWFSFSTSYDRRGWIPGIQTIRKLNNDLNVPYNYFKISLLLLIIPASYYLWFLLHCKILRTWQISTEVQRSKRFLVSQYVVQCHNFLPHRLESKQVFYRRRTLASRTYNCISKKEYPRLTLPFQGERIFGNRYHKYSVIRWQHSSAVASSRPVLCLSNVL